MYLIYNLLRCCHIAYSGIYVRTYVYRVNYQVKHFIISIVSNLPFTNSGSQIGHFQVTGGSN